ncbi:hypothetical protein STEG23_021510, partial [Scotinomys teguina]
EICLLLAAPIYLLKEDDGIHMEFALIVAKLATGPETALASTADSMLSKLDKQDTKVKPMDGSRTVGGSLLTGQESPWALSSQAAGLNEVLPVP